LSTICTQYGKLVGIAVQIRDDIMGLYGDPKEMGKAVGNDVREGKKTLLMQHAYSHGNAKQKKVIEGALNQPMTEAQLKEVQQVVEDTGSLAYSRQLAEKHVEEGIRVLDALPDSEQKQVLIELAQYMINRAK
jgi:geranylgeranyl pyrophosphate synthase